MNCDYCNKQNTLSIAIGYSLVAVCDSEKCRDKAMEDINKAWNDLGPKREHIFPKKTLKVVK